LITARLSNDIFNKDNESFPQFQQLLEDEYSINLRAEYRYKGKTRQSWINIINPFRGVLVSGSPGSDAWLKNKSNFPVEPAFYTINFDDLSRSHRCNPSNPESMLDITDAVESAPIILIGLNREWIKRQGDFFVESSFNFMTAVI
jgi:hypothetical protein